MKKYLLVLIFGVAMGYLEAAVVTYLREIYCPSGFSFPLPMPPMKMYFVELGRELSTLVMLGAVAFLFGQDRWMRFAYFSFLFSVWDIFYYIGLYLLIRWPTSLFAWDILFSIPVSWAAPVIAPIIVSLLLLLFSGFIFFLSERGYRIKTTLVEKVAVFGGFILIFLSMTIDALREPRYYLQVQQERLSFHWGLFLLGLILTVSGVIHIVTRGFKSLGIIHSKPQRNY